MGAIFGAASLSSESRRVVYKFLTRFLGHPSFFRLDQAFLRYDSKAPSLFQRKTLGIWQKHALSTKRFHRESFEKLISLLRVKVFSTSKLLGEFSVSRQRKSRICVRRTRKWEKMRSKNEEWKLSEMVGGRSRQVPNVPRDFLQHLRTQIVRYIIAICDADGGEDELICIIWTEIWSWNVLTFHGKLRCEKKSNTK